VILVDSSVLSLAYRRRRRNEPEPRSVTVLRQLIIDDVPLAIPGIVLQEMVSERKLNSINYKERWNPFRLLSLQRSIISLRRESRTQPFDWSCN
jgi:predicted nucleic acid-binding protein